MVNSQYFIAKDYLRAFDLKNLFHKYVVIYSQLNYPDGEEPLSNKDRHELTLKLDEAMNEITLQVLKMKETKPATDALKKPLVPSVNTVKQSREYRTAN
jgi:hypothetical protein